MPQDTGDVFSWNKATAGINNIIMGKLWIDWYGDITVRNHATGETALLQLHPCKGKLAQRGAVSGTVQGTEGQGVYAISGNYMRAIAAQLTPEEAAARGLEEAAPQVLYQVSRGWGSVPVGRTAITALHPSAPKGDRTNRTKPAVWTANYPMTSCRHPFCHTAYA